MVILLREEEEVIDLINTYAPEHLILLSKNAREMAEKVENAGSIFIGYYTPESAGDYASGTNHTLPTNGAARAYSGVSLDSFVKNITYQEITKEGIQNIGPTVEVMAEAESLRAHKNAVTVRLNSLKKK
jgi:histidinol dehydrogenase